MKRRKPPIDNEPPEQAPTRRAFGRRLLAELAGIKRRKAALILERSDIDVRLAALEQDEASTLEQIAAAEVELSTAKKRREPLAPPVSAPPVDELTRQRALRALAKLDRPR